MISKSTTETVLNQNHWMSETYRERMTTAQWKNVLLLRNDRIVFQGVWRQLIAKKLGYGVVEVYKDPNDVN